MDLVTGIELTNALFVWYASKQGISFREAGQTLAALTDTDVDRLRKIIEDFKASR